MSKTLNAEGTPAVAGAARCYAAPCCAEWKCEESKLKWMRIGESHQTRNGFFTIYADGYYCPKCGAGYGGSEPHNS